MPSDQTTLPVVLMRRLPAATGPWRPAGTPWGLRLRPQHFQQQDRYAERLVRQRAEGITPFPWGLRHLGLNRR
jgi:hypothetical protein